MPHLSDLQSQIPRPCWCQSPLPHLKKHSIHNTSPSKNSIHNTSLTNKCHPKCLTSLIYNPYYLAYVGINPHCLTQFLKLSEIPPSLSDYPKYFTPKYHHLWYLVQDFIIHIISPCSMDNPKYLTLLQGTISTTSRVSYLCSILYLSCFFNGNDGSSDQSPH